MREASAFENTDLAWRKEVGAGDHGRVKRLGRRKRRRVELLTDFFDSIGFVPEDNALRGLGDMGDRGPSGDIGILGSIFLLACDRGSITESRTFLQRSIRTQIHRRCPRAAGPHGRGGSSEKPKCVEESQGRTPSPRSPNLRINPVLARCVLEEALAE